MTKIHFEAQIAQFREKGEKSGWTYIEVPFSLSEEIMPGNKKSFRVKGKLDDFAFEGIALWPMGEGNFIMPLNGSIRKEIGKQQGDTVKVEMEADTKEPPLSAELLDCLQDDPSANAFFNSLSKGHQRYFSNWIEAAKTAPTKVKRMAQAVNGLAMGLGFSEMIRANKKS